MNPLLAFIIFFIFLLCQYCILLVSDFIAGYFGMTGRLYYATVVVAFLILNEFCFGGFVNETIVFDDSEDEEDIWE